MKKFIFGFIFSLALFFKSHGHELAIATLFKNCAPYLKEWVEYHKLVGVDHFWLYNDDSDDDWEEVLKPYIDQGLVEVFYWPKPGKTWFTIQRRAIKDGLQKARNAQTKWLALIDQDEFLLPMGDDKTVTECLNKHFKNAAAVYINWKNFGTSGVTLKKGEGMLPKLTSCSLPSHSRNLVGKSIVRPEAVDMRSIGYVHHFPLIDGKKYMNGDAEIIPLKKGSPLVSGKHYKYLRINHYPFRDEKYYREVRLPRDKNVDHSAQTIDAYKKFNLDKDFRIIRFLQLKHPKAYKKLWNHD